MEPLDIELPAPIFQMAVDIVKLRIKPVLVGDNKEIEHTITSVARQRAVLTENAYGLHVTVLDKGDDRCRAHLVPADDPRLFAIPGLDPVLFTRLEDWPVFDV